MKKIFTLLAIVIILSACSSDNDVAPKESTITLNFNHKWNDETVSKTDFNNIKFTNEFGTKLSIERYRYVLSNITLTDINGNSTLLKDYILINLGTEENLTFSTSNFLKNGTYKLSFTFGFDDEDNIDGAYLDLNTTSFEVPMMLGGGYHYMQFDGKFLDVNDMPVGFNYHAIRAADNSDPANLILTDTSFTVNLGEVTIENNEVTVNINVNIAEWFKNPNEWNLNELHQMLMPNYDAQILMNQNGKSVFSL